MYKRLGITVTNTCLQEQNLNYNLIRMERRIISVA
jgi:hypothetical protein